MNGYTKHEIAKRDEIAEMVRSGESPTAVRVKSIEFIVSNKKRRAKRMHLLKSTVRMWITFFNAG